MLKVCPIKPTFGAVERLSKPHCDAFSSRHLPRHAPNACQAPYKLPIRMNQMIAVGGNLALHQRATRFIGAEKHWE
jgi:hypothetical protein